MMELGGEVIGWRKETVVSSNTGQVHDRAFIVHLAEDAQCHRGLPDPLISDDGDNEVFGDIGQGGRGGRQISAIT
jgi:hypothetical protein